MKITIKLMLFSVEYIRISPFLIFFISQGSVATWLRCGGENDEEDIIGNSLLNLKVKEFSTNLWQSYERIMLLVFFIDSQCTS